MEPGTMPAEWESVFVLDERTVQLGAGDHAVRIIGPARRTVQRLQANVAAREFDAAEEVDAGGDPAPRPADLPHAGVPPASAAGLIRMQARRQLAAVLIEGLPRPAALLAEQLTALGLGLLLLRDNHRVDRADVTAGYPAAAAGLTRAAAVRRACLRQHPEAAVVTSTVTVTSPSTVRPSPAALPAADPPAELPQERVDIHVIFAERAVAPARLALAATRAQLVLPVVRHLPGTGSGWWQLGPLLSRDHGPCAQCLQLHGTASDPHWETVQTALAAQPPSTSPAADPEPPLSAAVVASLLAREVQLALDGEITPQTASRMIRVSLSTGELTLEPVTPHPECACRLNTPAQHPHSTPRLNTRFKTPAPMHLTGEQR